MAIKKIIKYPAPSLRTRCRPVRFPLDKEFLDHLQDLRDTLAATPNGLALASNQILAEGWRVFVVKGTGWSSQLPEIAVNPIWTPISAEKTKLDEGCLSVPELNLKVDRHGEIKLEWMSAINGNICSTEFSKLDAQIVQHECEHLDGQLIVDHASEKVQLKTRVDAIRNRRAGR